MSRKYDNEGPTLRVRLGYAEKENATLRSDLAKAREEAQAMEDAHSASAARAIAAERARDEAVTEVARLKDMLEEHREHSTDIYAKAVAIRKQRDEAVAALDGVWCAMDGKGNKCWCAYARLIHPPDDPPYGIALEPNGHTKECNAARRVLAASTGEAARALGRTDGEG